MKHNTRRLGFAGLATVAAAGLMLAGTASAKTINVAGNNTPYNEADVQKLASTAVSMGVKEPVKLDLQSGNLTVSGSTATRCVIKVGSGNTPKIGGISCK